MATLLTVDGVSQIGHPKAHFYLRRLARRSISAPDSDFGGEGGVYTEFRSLRSHFGQRMDFLVSIVNI